MELSTLESEMLIDIYDADMLPEMPFEIENYNLIEKTQKNKKHEFAFHLKKLRSLGLIKYVEKEVFSKGGSRNTKYDNNVTSICGDKIHIDSKGVKLVERYNYDKSETEKKCIYLVK